MQNDAGHKNEEAITRNLVLGTIFCRNGTVLFVYLVVGWWKK